MKFRDLPLYKKFTAEKEGNPIFMKTATTENDCVALCIESGKYVSEGQLWYFNPNSEITRIVFTGMHAMSEEGEGYE